MYNHLKMKINNYQIIFIFLFFFTSSCKKPLTELAFEKNVMLEIFPELIDSTCYDLRIYRNPPPLFGKQIFTKSGQYIGVDSSTISENEKAILKKWEEGVEAIKKDTSSIFIAFDPVISNNTENVKDDFEKHFSTIKLDTNRSKNNVKLVLDIEKIRLNNKFKLKNSAGFSKGKASDWDIKYNFNFSGFIHFTRIQFDKNKSFGVLDAGYYCGGLCGRGNRIFIVKKNGKWVIDKMMLTWIS